MEDVSPKRKPRILLASGIFPPDLGGPAVHVPHIAEHFTSLGWEVTVIAFGDVPHTEPYRVIRVSRRYPKVITWALYGLRIFTHARTHDLVYAFDLTTAGVPAALASRFFHKAFFLRIPGDPIWERTVEKGRRFLPMRAYYEKRLYAEDRPGLYRLIGHVVRRAARVVTYCDFIKDIYIRYYRLAPERLTIIRNPFPEKTPTEPEQGTRTFVFAGRFVSYKNLPRVIRAFAATHRIHPHTRLLLIGDGPEEALIRSAAAPLGAAVSIVPRMNQRELFSRIAAASVALAPALTEFNPNFILESLALGKPALISHDNGLSAPLPAAWQFDPLDDESLATAMASMADPVFYKRALEELRSLPMHQTWDTVVREHEKLVREQLGL